MKNKYIILFLQMCQNSTEIAYNGQDVKEQDAV